MKGYITAKEAAKRLGYEYSYFRRLLSQGKVKRAQYWHGYALPEDISKEDVVGTPPKEKESQ